MSRFVRLGLPVVAVLLALVFSGVVATVVLLFTGDDVAGFWRVMLTWPSQRDLVDILNMTAILYLSGAAAAIGFRMNLFNIGVEGQYRIAGLFAGAFAGLGLLPGKLNVLAAILVAMAVGALWAGIAGALRVWRGVSEVISTIMLNAIAGSLIGYLLVKWGVSTGNARNTKLMPEDTWVGSWRIFPDVTGGVYLLAILAPLVGIVFFVLVYYTRFGFDLRAAGASESAAVSSGVSVKKMVFISMLLSGAVAGLIGLPMMFSDSHQYGSAFQTGLGFTGIAVALLGRNHPVGIAFGALIFAFLGQQANLLNILAGVSPDIVGMTQGIIVLAVVIAFEVIRRFANRIEQRQVAAQLAAERTNGSDAQEVSA
ncbi:MAG TPA: ABC transporter permease [Marmoricola sp.]|nr:ABC transporter permease [Marmoricola sp.]HNI70466.1 ABC transporter permease [Marmoricola sp.]HNO39090.1 ABC transporter permease [Marmoricola sp.]